MRATSTRRAPQRLIVDRTNGETTPLAPGACPHCFRVVSITPTGRRRAHRDKRGLTCTGSGVIVGEHEFTLGELPPVRIAPLGRPRGRRGSSAPLTLSGVEGVPYVGRSDYGAVANGRAVCPSCKRHLPMNSDGTIRKHRMRHQDPLAPYCDGGAS